ncbi:hypothetical protein RBB79_13895 [Tunturiibacter empetritectus]|uniref:Uncharacterized protein n=1 Tax=Tunturiibacter lichenicola TaxID=2051959 RepID=A0A852VHY7_9BACT|nr:hypothetical protein [Edaphobacter lichenicola]NYF90699.1 hypothetical protein [Edaphobacter lichenicola]
MRSKKMDRSKTAEGAFEAELNALYAGIRNMRGFEGDYLEDRKKLFRVTLSYMDELNKVRKYACPLSTNILLGSILESLLLALVLEHSSNARKSKVWEKAEKDQSRKAERISVDIPILYFSELIEITDNLKLFRTSGLQQKIDLLILEDVFPFLRGENRDRMTRQVKENTWDAKRNHELMHQLRGFRNAVHPLQVISSKTKVDPDEFVKTVWSGLRLLVLLNEMFGFNSPLRQS